MAHSISHFLLALPARLRDEKVESTKNMAVGQKIGTQNGTLASGLNLTHAHITSRQRSTCVRRSHRGSLLPPNHHQRKMWYIAPPNISTYKRYIYIYIYIYTYLHMYVYMCKHPACHHHYISGVTCVPNSVKFIVCIHIYTYVHIYVYVHIYIHIFNKGLQPQGVNILSGYATWLPSGLNL